MARGPFDPQFKDLPKTLPIFALSGVMVLPGMGLQLNIFEPRYISLIQDVLRTDRLFGIVGFKEPQQEESPNDTDAPLARVGCCARIIGFEETSDGRLHIHAVGLLRFNWTQELQDTEAKYRQIVPQWSDWANDLSPEEIHEVDRNKMIDLVSSYIGLQDLSADLDILKDGSNDEQFINALAMGCPLDPREKQALLEAPTVKDRAQLFSALLTMALNKGNVSGGISLN